MATSKSTPTRPLALREHERHLITSMNDNTMTVTDPNGGVWWPSAEALVEIMTSEDPAAKAVEIVEAAPMRGEWRQ